MISPSSVLLLSFFELMLFFFNKKLIRIFLEKGIKRRNPIVSEKNPGMISRKAATAIEAPHNFFYWCFILV